MKYYIEQPKYRGRWLDVFLWVSTVSAAVCRGGFMSRSSAYRNAKRFYDCLTIEP